MVWAVSSALEDFFESILFIAKISTDLAVAAVAAKAPPQFVAFQARFKISSGVGLFDVTSESVSEICLESAYFTLYIKKTTTKLYKMKVTRPAKKPRESLLGF